MADVNYRAYWDTSFSRVPHQTGAEGLEDLSDFDAWCAGTGFTLEGRILDIGCGTGRLSQRCANYVGVDVAPMMVEYAKRTYNADARLTETPTDLPDGPFDRIVALSVFTHIARVDRQAYLAEVRSRLQGEALIDILPGRESGNIGAWYASDEDFRADLSAAGLNIICTFDWQAKDASLHRYFRLK